MDHMSILGYYDEAILDIYVFSHGKKVVKTDT